MSIFTIIGPLVLAKKIFEGFYHIWVWWPSWSCDLDNLYKLLFSFPKKFGFDWPSGFGVDLKMVDDNRPRSMGILYAHLQGKTLIGAYTVG